MQISENILRIKFISIDANKLYKLYPSSCKMTAETGKCIHNTEFGQIVGKIDGWVSFITQWIDVFKLKPNILHNV